MEDLLNQINNIAKAGAYDIVAKQRDELLAENESLKISNAELLTIAKRVAFVFGNEQNYPEGTTGYKLRQDALVVIEKYTYKSNT